MCFSFGGTRQWLFHKDNINFVFLRKPTVCLCFCYFFDGADMLCRFFPHQHVVTLLLRRKSWRYRFYIMYFCCWRYILQRRRWMISFFFISLTNILLLLFLVRSDCLRNDLIFLNYEVMINVKIGTNCCWTVKYLYIYFVIHMWFSVRSQNNSYWSGIEAKHKPTNKTYWNWIKHI